MVGLRIEYTLSTQCAPSAEVRQWLQRRSTEIAGWMAPAGPDRVHAPLDLMLGCLRFQNDHEEDTRIRRKAYYLAMSDLPLFAVEAACMTALRGKVGDFTGRFAPQPGELHKAARSIMASLQRERADIERILCAKVTKPIAITKEERAAIVARIRAQVMNVVEDATL